MEQDTHSSIAARCAAATQEVETAVCFCTLEALQNAAKYAKPGEVVVRLLEESGELVFTIEDDGEGFDPATTKLGCGPTQKFSSRLRWTIWLAICRNTASRSSPRPSQK